MKPKRESASLYVFMGGLRVGELVRASSGQLAFTYDHAWLLNENSSALSLSLPLTESTYKGDLVENYFDNLLPDSLRIRKRIQTRFAVHSHNPFDLLSPIGRDCVGALQLLQTPELPKMQQVMATPLKDAAIATILKHYQVAPLGMDQGLDFRISIAGAQEKTALLRYKDQWCLPQGATPTSHIIKLPIGRIEHSNMDLSDSVENEWLCLKILSEFNLPVNHAEMVHFDDVKALVVERFDRQWQGQSEWLLRLPQEDFCQALGVSSAMKYQSDGGPSILDIMNVLRGSVKPQQDRAQFMKTVFLFWMMGAIDGHAKNFSIYLKRQGAYHLTPIYDVLSVYPLVQKKQIQRQNIKMAMSVRGKNRHYYWDKIQARHWLSTAAYCGFPEDEMKAIMDDVCDSLEGVIVKVSRQLPPGFPAPLAEAIFEGMSTVKKQCVNR